MIVIITNIIGFHRFHLFVLLTLITLISYYVNLIVGGSTGIVLQLHGIQDLIEKKPIVEFHKV